MTWANAVDLREAFGSFMTGVTVVTAMSEEGAPVGFTANSYASVSLDPPLLLVCPSKSLTSFPVFNACKHFVVNILSENQQDISNIFATAKDDRFAQVSWRQDGWNCPIIEGVAASFCCSAHSRFDAGDHIVLMGAINQFQCTGTAGLGYSKEGYFSLGLERKAVVLPRSDRKVIAGAIIEFGGKILVEKTPAGVRLPQVVAKRGQGVFTAINALVADAGFGVEFGPVYSIFENKTSDEIFTFYRCVAEAGIPCGLGEFMAIEELTDQVFASAAHTKMMQRYFLEHKSGVFALYVGDEAHGEVHMFGEDFKE
jgi:flavin-dependent trigonelline monooxygenase, reductase component